MGRFRVLSGSEVCRILEENDFVLARQRGSHKIMQQRAEGITILQRIDYNAVGAHTASQAAHGSSAPGVAARAPR